MSLQEVVPQGGSSSTNQLPPNVNSNTAATVSSNGTYLWIYNGMISDMLLTRTTLLMDSGSGRYTQYTTNTFNLGGQLPVWNSGYPSMSCLVGTLMYVIRYHQINDSVPMSFISFVIDLSDDR